MSKKYKYQDPKLDEMAKDFSQAKFKVLKGNWKITSQYINGRYIKWDSLTALIGHEWEFRYPLREMDAIYREIFLEYAKTL